MRHLNKVMVFSVLVSLTFLAYASEYVHGYYRSNGTYVHSYHRSNPDSNSYNNYSSRGNVNPYTGKEGHETPGYDNGDDSSVYEQSNQNNNY